MRMPAYVCTTLYISRVKHTYDHVPSVSLSLEVIEESISLLALWQLLITLGWEPSLHSSVSFSMLVQSHFSQPIIKDKVILSLPRRGARIEISSVHPICLGCYKAALCIFLISVMKFVPWTSKPNRLFGGQATLHIWLQSSKKHSSRSL